MWHRVTLNMFKHLRNNNDRTHPEMTKTQVILKYTYSTPDKKKVSSAWGLPYFLPSRYVEDDDASL